MTQQFQQRTAKIYEFPKRNRSASSQATAAHKPHDYDPRFDAVEYGTGWYHQAAVEDAVEAQTVPFRKH